VEKITARQRCSSGEKVVFKRRPKTASEGADVTSEGRAFQTRAPAIGHALRPIVDCW